MQEQQKEIAVKQNTELQVVNPEIIEALKEWGADDLQVPILKLLQSTSDAVKKGIGKYGEFQDPVTGNVFGKEVEVIVMGPPKNGAIYFDKSKGPGMICKSLDQVKSINNHLCTECPFGVYHGGEWVNGQSPKCCKSKEFLCVLRSSLSSGIPYPIMLSFIKTSYKIGKSLANKVRSNLTFRQAMFYEMSYVITSIEEKNSQGDFMVYSIKEGSRLEGEERETAKKMYEFLKGKDFRLNVQDSGFEQDV